MTETLRILGYPDDARVLIIHADDVGFSHASNVAALPSLTEGSLTCASALVPAPWFAETAKLQREHPQLDIGVHMTLTAEYETYRWRSMTGAPALHAPDGGMWRDVASVIKHVDVDTAKAELRAQIEHALAMGVDVTHIDTHMGTVMQPKYLPSYIDLAIEYRLPVFFIRPSERRLGALGADAPLYAEQTERLASRGWPLLDQVIVRTLSEVAPEDKETQFKAWFAELRSGLTHFLCHPATGGDELDAMSPTDARHRAKEAELFGTPTFREHCAREGVQLIGYREIRERLRASG